MAAQNPSLTLSSGEAAYRRARIGIVGGSKKTDALYAIENGRTVLEGSKDDLLNDPDFSNEFLGLD